MPTLHSIFSQSLARILHNLNGEKQIVRNRVRVCVWEREWEWEREKERKWVRKESPVRQEENFLAKILSRFLCRLRRQQRRRRRQRCRHSNFFTPTMKFFCFIFTDFLPSLPLSTCDDVTIFFAAQTRRVFYAQSCSAFSFANHKEK